MDDEERARLAKEVIAQAAMEWENKPDAHVDVVKNTPHFVFVLHTHEAFHGKDCNHADTVIHYNPYVELIEHMKASEAELDRDKASKSEQAKLIKQYASDHLDVMLNLASRHFADSLWQLSIVANTTARSHIMGIFGRYDLRKQFIDSSIDLLTGRWRDRWCTRRNVKAKHYKISAFALNRAIDRLLYAGLGKDEITQYKVAKQLTEQIGEEVSEMNVYNFCTKTCGFNSFNEYRDEFIKHLNTSEVPALRANTIKTDAPKE